MFLLSDKSPLICPSFFTKSLNMFKFFRNSPQEELKVCFHNVAKITGFHMQCMETPNTATAWNAKQVNAPHKTLHKEQTKQTAALTSFFNPPFNVHWCYIDRQAASLIYTSSSLLLHWITINISSLNCRADLFSIHISVSENAYSVSSVFQKVHSCLTQFLLQFLFCSLIHLFCYLQSFPS